MAEGGSLEIESYRISLTDKLGQGAFGVVYVGKHIKNGEKVAVKRCELRSDKHGSIAMKEIKNFKQLENHPNIVRLMDYHFTQNSFWMIMEFCDAGDLGEYVKAVNPDLDSKVHIMYQCACAIAFMHSRPNPVIHRDIKPANILMKTEGRKVVVKVADFGISKVVEGNLDPAITVMLTTAVGTPGFMAPEFFLQEPYTSSVDVFALGLVYLSLLDYNPVDAALVPLSASKKKQKMIMPVGMEMAQLHSMGMPQSELTIDSSEDTPQIKQLKKLVNLMAVFDRKQRMKMHNVEEELHNLRDVAMSCNRKKPLYIATNLKELNAKTSTDRVKEGQCRIYEELEAVEVGARMEKLSPNDQQIKMVEDKNDKTNPMHMAQPSPLNLPVQHTLHKVNSRPTAKINPMPLLSIADGKAQLIDRLEEDEVSSLSFTATEIPSPQALDSSVKQKIPPQHKPTTARPKYIASALGPNMTDEEPKIQQAAMQQTQPQHITSYRSTSVRLSDFKNTSLFSRATSRPYLTETFKLETQSGFRLCYHNNQLWLPTVSENSIDVYSMSGTLQRSITSDRLQRPRSIYPLDDVNMILADANGLFLMDSYGKVSRKIMAGNMRDVHLDGNTVVALEHITEDQGKVHVLNRDKALNVEKSFLLEKNPVQSIMIVSGNIYVSFKAHDDERYNDYIGKYKMNGNKLTQYGKHGNGGPGELQLPVICASDPEGSLLIADWENKCLQMLDSKGQWSIMMNLPGDIHAVLDVVFDGQQHMYVLCEDDDSESKILKYKI